MLLFYHSLLAHIQVEIQGIHADAVQHGDHNRTVLLLNEAAGILDIVAEQAIIYTACTSVRCTAADHMIAVSWPCAPACAPAWAPAWPCRRMP